MNTVLSPDAKREALRVVRLLAQGLNPETLQRLEPTNVCQSGPVIRALFIASEVLKINDSPESTASEKKGKPSGRQGKPWLKDEDQELLKAFQPRHCLRSIAARHQRTEEGIASRLVRLGQTRDRAEARQRLS